MFDDCEDEYDEEYEDVAAEESEEVGGADEGCFGSLSDDPPSVIVIDGQVCTEISRNQEPGIYRGWGKAVRGLKVKVPRKIYDCPGCPAAVAVMNPSDPNDDIGLVDLRLFHETCEKFGDGAYDQVFAHEGKHQELALRGLDKTMTPREQENACDAASVFMAKRAGVTMEGFKQLLKDTSGDLAHPSGDVRVRRAEFQSDLIDRDSYKEFIDPEKNPYIAAKLGAFDRAWGIG